MVIFYWLYNVNNFFKSCFALCGTKSGSNVLEELRIYGVLKCEESGPKLDKRIYWTKVRGSLTIFLKKLESRLEVLLKSKNRKTYPHGCVRSVWKPMGKDLILISSLDPNQNQESNPRSCLGTKLGLDRNLGIIFFWPITSLTPPYCTFCPPILDMG